MIFNVIRITVLLYCLLLLGCSSGSDKVDNVGDRIVTKPDEPEEPKQRLAAQPGTNQIDTSRIRRLTMQQALAMLGKPFDREEYDFPEANAAGLREGLTQYIPIDSKQQFRIRQLTWKRGRYRTTVFYWYVTGNWRPLYWYNWEDGMVF